MLALVDQSPYQSVGTSAPHMTYQHDMTYIRTQHDIPMQVQASVLPRQYSYIARTYMYVCTYVYLYTHIHETYKRTCRHKQLHMHTHTSDMLCVVHYYASLLQECIRMNKTFTYKDACTRRHWYLLCDLSCLLCIFEAEVQKIAWETKAHLYLLSKQKHTFTY
jgi:hypothetical protein